MLFLAMPESKVKKNEYGLGRRDVGYGGTMEAQETGA